MIKVIDNFLSQRAYNDLIAQIECGPFEDEINPIDGVMYPHICKVIPKSVTDEVSAIVPGEFTEFM